MIECEAVGIKVCLVDNKPVHISPAYKQICEDLGEEIAEKLTHTYWQQIKDDG